MKWPGYSRGTVPVVGFCSDVFKQPEIYNRPGGNTDANVLQRKTDTGSQLDDVRAQAKSARE